MIKAGDTKTFELGDLLNYEQPTEYIVKSSKYNNKNKTPVLTAGKTFILGYTDEKTGIFEERLPVIIFDDFTTAIKFVDFPFKVKSSAMKILLANEDKTNIKYLFYIMQGINFTVRKHKRHWISEYSKIKVSIPTPSEQKRIMDKIDKLFIEINKAIEQTKIALYNSKRILDSKLKEFFENQSDDFLRMTLEEISEKVKSGGTPNTSNKKFYGGDIPFVKISDITYADKFLKETKLKITKEGLASSSSWLVPRDSLILSMYGTVGKVVITTFPVAITQNMAGIVAHEDISISYLYYAFRHIEKNELKKHLKLSVHQHFGIGEAKKIQILIPIKNGKPNLLKQEEIASEFEKIENATDELYDKYQEQLNNFNKLKKSILHQAFQGKL